MLTIKNYPNNRDEFVGAETLMKFLHGRTSGVFSMEDSASVTAKQNSMAVNVSDGYGWMADAEGNGCVWWVESKKTTGELAELPIDPADAVLSRIDRVIVNWDTTQYTEYPVLKVLKGSNSSNPQPPALTNNSTIRQISLAQVRVNAGALKITSADITDDRLNPAVCGLVTYSEKVPTEMINAQFEALLALLKKQIDQTASGVLPDGSVTPDKLSQSVIDLLHPVGSWWLSDDPTSPASLFGGTWERLSEHRGLISADDGDGTYSVGTTGGSETVTLTESQMPAHKHTDRLGFGSGTKNTLVDGNTKAIYITNSGVVGRFGLDRGDGNGMTTTPAGGGLAHENMGPWYATYIWRRTA